MSNFDRILIVMLILLIGGLAYVGVSYNGRINRISEKLDTYEAKISSLIKENTALKERINKLGNHEAGQSSRVEDLQGLAANINELDNRVEELAGKIDSDDEDLKKELARIKEKINQLEVSKNEQSSKIEALQEETTNLDDRIEELTEKISSSNPTYEPDMSDSRGRYLNTDKFGNVKNLVIRQGATISSLEEEVDRFSDFGNIIRTTPLKVGYVNASDSFGVFTSAVKYEREQVKKKTEKLVRLREQLVQREIFKEEYNRRSDILQAEKLKAQLAVDIGIIKKMLNAQGFDSVSDQLKQLKSQVDPVMKELNKVLEKIKNGSSSPGTEEVRQTLNQINIHYERLDNLLTQLIETKIFKVTKREANNQGYDLVFLQENVTTLRRVGVDDLTEDIKAILRWEMS